MDHCIIKVYVPCLFSQQPRHMKAQKHKEMSFSIAVIKFYTQHEDLLLSQHVEIVKLKL